MRLFPLFIPLLAPMFYEDYGYHQVEGSPMLRKWRVFEDSELVSNILLMVHELFVLKC